MNILADLVSKNLKLKFFSVAIALLVLLYAKSQNEISIELSLPFDGIAKRELGIAVLDTVDYPRPKLLSVVVDGPKSIVEELGRIYSADGENGSPATNFEPIPVTYAWSRIVVNQPSAPNGTPVELEYLVFPPGHAHLFDPSRVRISWRDFGSRPRIAYDRTVTKEYVLRRPDEVDVGSWFKPADGFKIAKSYFEGRRTEENMKFSVEGADCLLPDPAPGETLSPVAIILEKLDETTVVELYPQDIKGMPFGRNGNYKFRFVIEIAPFEQVPIVSKTYTNVRVRVLDDGTLRDKWVVSADDTTNVTLRGPQNVLPASESQVQIYIDLALFLTEARRIEIGEKAGQNEIFLSGNPVPRLLIGGSMPPAGVSIVDPAPTLVVRLRKR
ncbi:MAG: hypothetical protein NUW37_12265 [Planctomycetes bacterium]|nr:hypothetical protein [Planctomycetota bacterium]